MIESAELKQAVIANRDDDTPRLIYADWLDENGQSDRAAFIRAQVEAASAVPFSLSARKAHRRAENLLKLHRNAWTRHLHKTVVETPRFHRGFIDHVAVQPTDSKAVAAIFNSEPLQSIRMVRLASDAEWFTLLPLLELQQLQQVRCLELANILRFEHDEYKAILESAYLGNIRRLSLRGSGVQPAWFIEMICGSAFPNLVELDIADISNLGPGLLQALNKAPHRELKSLDASRVTSLISEHWQQVLTSPCLANIEELRLGSVELLGRKGPMSELDLGWVIPWTRLALLDLDGQRLGDVAVEEIALREEARSLKWLGLANNALGPESIKTLVRSKHLNLQYLDVRENRFTPTAVAALKERFPDAQIEH
jgi:uncharacterized protein (TIGR02996 family)